MPGHVLIISRSSDARADTLPVALQFSTRVTVRDSLYQLVIGQPVQFISLAGAPGIRQIAMLAPVGSLDFASTASDTTDDTGVAATSVRLQPVDGTALVLMSVPERGLSDTLSFTITPYSPRF